MLSKNTSSPKKLFSAALFLTSISMVSHSAYAKDSQWEESEKAEICKAYIGELFFTDIGIINHYKTDSNGKVYVKYNRPSDNSLWQYVCSVNDNNIVWAGWLKDTKEWGRWRNEDRAEIKTTKGGKVLIDIPNYEEDTEVSF